MSSAVILMCFAFAFMMFRNFGRRGRWDRESRWDRGGGEAREREVREVREMAERLDKRDEQVEQLEGRVAELESRLDFAERLLAPRREPALSPPHNGSL